MYRDTLDCYLNCIETHQAIVRILEVHSVHWQFQEGFECLGYFIVIT